MSGDQDIGGYTNAYESSVVMIDDQGWTVPFTQSQHFMGPQFVYINSDNRDITLYPNPSSFELKMPGHFRNVTSIELVDILVPNPIIPNSSPVTQLIPEGEMYYLLNGLFDQDPATGIINTNSYRSQTPNRFGRLYRQPLALMKNQTGSSLPNTTYSSLPLPSTATLAIQSAQNTVTPYWNWLGYNPTHANDSFGRFRYLSTVPNQFWERLGSRKVNYYKPEIEKLDTLQLSLVGGDGAPLYPPAVFGTPKYPTPIVTWSATLLVQCRAS